MEIGSYGWKRNIDFIHHGLGLTGGQFIQCAPMATANYGCLNLGPGGFDGVSPGHFSGSSAGTVVAINVPAAFTGRLLDLQVGGVSGFNVAGDGTLTLNRPLQLFNALTYYNGSLPANGQLLIGNATNSNFSLATLTAGTGVTITNGAGAITIAATGAGGASSPTQTVDAYYQFT